MREVKSPLKIREPTLDPAPTTSLLVVVGDPEGVEQATDAELLVELDHGNLLDRYLILD